MSDVIELTRRYLAAYEAKQAAEREAKRCGRELRDAGRALAEAGLEAGVTRQPVDGRMVSWREDLSATVDRTVPPETLVRSLEEHGLGELIQRNAVSVNPQSLSAALRRLREELAEEGRDLPEIPGVKVSGYLKVTNSQGKS